MQEIAGAAPDAGGKTFRSLGDLIESGRPLVYIHTAEEQRVADLLRALARRKFDPPAEVWTWSLTEGLRGPANDVDDSTDPRVALDYIAGHSTPAIFHLKDFHQPLMDDPRVRRRLRDLYESCFGREQYIFISSPVLFVPDELGGVIVTLTLPLPEPAELAGLIRTQVAERGGAAVDDDAVAGICRALQGLTLDESRHAIRRALRISPTLGPESLSALYEEKRLLVNRLGTLEYVADGIGIERVGGLEIMKKWLLARRKLFQMRDQLSADIVPKGVLVMGISGCGKSLSVKAIASCFELPLYRINMNEIFSGRHGTPEGAFVAVCRRLEEIAPAVVWFDEIEMGVTSAESSGEQGRIFAFFLTWMQEKVSGLFVAATANRIDLLPAEMIRKGRFDEVFFVDLPLDDERIEIFRIHLMKRGIDADHFNLERLKKLTKGWTGAEVEQCVVSALTTAKLEDREPNEEDLLRAGGRIVPLSKTMKEQCDHIRSWAFDRAVRASPSEFGR